MPKCWSYQRTDENGRLQSYYGICQKWTYTDIKANHEIEIKYFQAKPNGVQYYWISIDGKFQEKPLSAARLHYLLNEKRAQEVKPGVLQPLPLQVEEVLKYRKQATNRPGCGLCGGTGIKDNGKICICTHYEEEKIKNYNAQLRLKALLKV